MSLTPSKKLALEMWLAERAKLNYVFWGAGLTDRPSRKAVMRKALLARAEDVCGKGPDGKVQTYAQVFERIYDEPLVLIPKDPATHTADRDAEKRQV